MVRAMAAGGDAVKPSGKSSVGIHQRTLPQEQSSLQALELEPHVKQEKSLMLLI